MPSFCTLLINSSSFEMTILFSSLALSINFLSSIFSSGPFVLFVLIIGTPPPPPPLPPDPEQELRKQRREQWHEKQRHAGFRCRPNCGGTSSHRSQSSSSGVNGSQIWRWSRFDPFEIRVRQDVNIKTWRSPRDQLPKGAALAGQGGVQLSSGPVP